MYPKKRVGNSASVLPKIGHPTQLQYDVTLILPSRGSKLFFFTFQSGMIFTDIHIPRDQNSYRYVA